ncbi:MAG: DEAD/DEAH box helicase [Alphaproteobacteria bacterium]|nr:DEAD/DEAH box helicase [Alphaproteobacteria bacterium]
MSFAELALHPLIRQALDSEGYAEATPIQAAAIPPALEGRDILATAATGTGKTAAFLLPALTRLANAPGEGPIGAPRILILAPTRELALQVGQAVRKHGKFLRLNIAEIVGGMPYREQLRLLARPVDVVIATPGRLMDHMHRDRIDLGCVETLILDEADRMLDLGFAEDVDVIAMACGAERQTMLFTATLDKRMAQLAGKLLKDPVRIAVQESSAPLDIAQQLYLADNFEHKRKLLYHFVSLPELGKAIVFMATKRDADAAAEELAQAGHLAACLHGDMDQRARSRTMQALRTGAVKLLVATDVAARGIDVRDISHVINFDLPRDPSDYVHRIGRTGRAGAAGVAISLASPAEHNLIQAIERFTRSAIEIHVVPGLEPTRAVRYAPRPQGRPYGRPNGRHAGPHPARAPHGAPHGKPHGKPYGKPAHQHRKGGKPGAAAQGRRPG